MAVMIQGAEVFVRQSGHGHPVLFLHGNPDSADLWIDIIRSLQDNYRCVAIDLPGFARTRTPPDFDYSFANLSRFVDELVESIGLQTPLSVVAHDFGGAFAMAWAATYPDKVHRIVVINHPLFVAAYKWHFLARIWRTPMLGEISMALLNWPLFYCVMRAGSKKLTTDHIRSAYARISESKRMVLKLYRAADPDEFKKWEPRMLAATARIPTLVLWGARDPFIHGSIADQFGARTVKRFYDSGHWAPIEIPEQISAELMTFLAD